MAGRFGAVVTAMVTPFRDDHALDLDGARALAAHLYERGSDSLVIAGSTGESPTLTHREKYDLFEAVIDVAKGKGKVLCGTGTYTTAETIELSREAEELGADGLLLVTPYYNKPPQRGPGRALHPGRQRRVDPGGRVQHPRADGDPHRARDAAADRRGREHRRREGLDRRLPVHLAPDHRGARRVRGLLRRRLGDVRLPLSRSGGRRLGRLAPRRRPHPADDRPHPVR